METIYQELKEQKNVRSNLSALRAQLKKDRRMRRRRHLRKKTSLFSGTGWKVTMQRRERMRHCY